jgi:iron complex transport system permease protein
MAKIMFLKKQAFISNQVILGFAVALLLLLIVLNLSLGSVAIPLREVLKILTGHGSDNAIWENIILRTRLPQTLVAFSAGMALGIAGLLMQTLFRNPLAGPSVLGISSGASLGVGFVVLVAGQVFGFSFARIGAWGDLTIIFASFAGALAVLLLILIISRKIGGTLGVLILGVMIGYLSNSIVGILKYYSREVDVHNYVIWGLGSFSRLSLPRAELFAMVTVLFSAFSIFLSKPLNLLALGDYYAQNLGLKIRKARTVIILASGFLTALVTAFCGPIAFIGLAVPHMAKMISHTSDHSRLIVNTCILGAITALLCNLVARLPGFEGELPINSVTAFVGAPVVISVILKKRRENQLE